MAASTSKIEERLRLQTGEEGKQEERKKEKEEVVTIGLYFKETDDRKAIRDFLDKEITQVKHILEKITAAANARGKKSPEFILSVLLIPNWSKKNNGYKNKTYSKAHAQFFRKLEKKIELECKVRCEDAYKGASLNEKIYLYRLTHMGANADWIKTHAIIKNHNVKHLQLDSNTQIDNYDKFYAATFGQDRCDAVHTHDALNASAYDTNSTYVSAHNKVVYTVPNGKIVTALKEFFLKYCKAHRTLTDPDKNKNAIYSKVFCPALAQIKLTIPKICTDPNEGKKTRYLVKFDCPEYKLTQHIITAVNMSWAVSSKLDPDATTQEKKTRYLVNYNLTRRIITGPWTVLSKPVSYAIIKVKKTKGKKTRYLVNYNLTQRIITGPRTVPSKSDPYAAVPALEYLGAKITFPCFLNLVTVHTAPFLWHWDRATDTDKKKYFALLKQFRTALHDREKDIAIIRKYCKYIATDAHAKFLPKLIEIFPGTTPDGKIFFQAVFGFPRTDERLEKLLAKLSGDPENPRFIKELQGIVANSPHLSPPTSSLATPTSGEEVNEKKEEEQKRLRP